MASIRKRNDKWQAQVRRIGHAPRTKSFINRADALRWIRQTELELDRTALAYDPATLDRTTVADLLRRYVRDVTPGKRGHASEAKRIEVFLRYDWANLTLARITPQAFTRYRDKRLREVEAGTVIRELGLLRTVFEVARREWDIPLHANPVANVRKPKAASGRNRRLHADEFAALLAACADGRTGWLEPGIKLAVETGMRRGELLNIRRADLDLTNGLLSIPETKTDIPRTIPLSEHAVLILRSVLDTATDDRLFPVSANAFRLAWERCKHRAAKDMPGIFDLRFHDLRHEAVPLFQRQYVWNEEHQWLPLWEDIERKFAETLAGRKDGPVHFLGAMVLDQKQTPTGHVVRRQVIDGQQRLTTLQIFLSAFRDLCREHGCNELADECAKFTLNSGMMSDPEIDKFKVWPTQLDRKQFSDVITAGSKSALLAKYPLVRKKYAQKYDPRPRMIEAYLFFYLQLEMFFFGEKGETPTAAEFPLSDRLEECFRTLKNALMVVIIDLQTSDDPQVIFETLNARGEPLLPADLLRNYIFLRATRDGDDAEALYRNYWQRFDEEFWRQEVKQGRLTRPRSDLFMQHFLASKQGQDIPIKHLYVEYRHWVERVRPFENVEEELATLSRQRDHFRRILEPNDGDPLFDLAVFMDAYDIRTGYPFLLALLEAEVANEEWLAISDVLQSYLLRRAVCALGTKNYNKIFLSLTRNLRRDGFTAVNVRNQLLAQTGDSSEWPDDTRFRESWLNAPIYNQQGNSRLVYLLSRLNETFASSKAEGLTFSAQPTIEHILPQSWQEHWPLVDGSKGLDLYELFQAEEGDTRASMTRSRNAKIQTIGNLTILSSGLNTAQSNLSWSDKLPELMRHSLLPINQALQGLVTWDETSIEARGRLLFDRALTIWTR